MSDTLGLSGGCPACKASLSEHLLADTDNYESWRYECGAEIVGHERYYEIERDCGGMLAAILRERRP